ncbi:MAG TPA: protein phosphatase, partial [Geodermatophilus sp.]|nr:protein phosphatase [Geodermatophilus sp.]
PPAPPPPTAAPPAAAPSDRRRSRRRLFLAGGTVLVLVGAGIAAWLWVLTHWFVGVAAADDGDHVAVFRGFNADLLGLDLYRIDAVTGIPLEDLTSYDQNSVRQGIEAGDADDAQRIVDDLQAAAVPECGRSGSGRATPSEAPSIDTDAGPPGLSTSAGASTPGSPTAAPEPGEPCREAE